MTDQLIYKRTSKTKDALSKSSYPNLNPWSNGKTKKIEVLDFFFNMKDVQWKGQTIRVEYDLFIGLAEQLISKGYTKEEALDELFEMSTV